MPEHFHVLISEPEKGTPSTVMQVVKQRFAWQVLRERQGRKRASQPSRWTDDELAQVWKARFYDPSTFAQDFGSALAKNARTGHPLEWW